MHEQFYFSTDSAIDPQESSLAMQLSKGSFSFAIYRAEDNRLLQLKHFSTPSLTTKKLDAILEQNEILQGSFSKIITGLDFGFSTMLPAEMGHTDAMPLMYLDHADQQDHTITELISEQNISNIYSVPSDILTWMVHQFPSSGYLHDLSVVIKMIRDFPEEGLLRVDIQDKKFSVVAFKSTRLLLARDYNYSSPADVVFYLLKICEVFALAQDQLIVQLSGLVEVDSKLFRGLYDYFLNISLKTANWNDTITGLPQHYFTSLNELTVCELLQEA